MNLGPVMIDVAGLTLDAVERERLQHPLVGGVILFARNYASVAQITELVAEIHALRSPRLLIGVDHEGGRVQRFRQGFTALPPPAVFGRLYAEAPTQARFLAETSGWLMATELRAVGVDFSFAPVLDLDRGISRVIGDRAFHHDPHITADLAHHYIIGMARAGMAATGKHFPGHGGVEADSHVAIPIDQRDYAAILAEDLLPFQRLIQWGLAAIMPAHVIYPLVDSNPAGFSRFWLQEILRKSLNFRGVIFSDDLSMEGAKVAGGVVDRAQAALAAGCDMVLVCNDPTAADKVLAGLDPGSNPLLQARLHRMHGHGHTGRAELLATRAYQQAVESITKVA